MADKNKADNPYELDYAIEADHPDEIELEDYLLELHLEIAEYESENQRNERILQELAKTLVLMQIFGNTGEEYNRIYKIYNTLN